MIFMKMTKTSLSAKSQSIKGARGHWVQLEHNPGETLFCQIIDFFHVVN